MAGLEQQVTLLKERLGQLPRKPGVYLMKDRKSEIIYIGKAKSLRHRVRSYFQETGAISPRYVSMISHIHDFEYIVTDSEVEALILEATLVKEHKPRYNVNLKDDKKFPYIKVTKEPFPRILATRVLEKDGGIYFGPYTEAKKMRTLLNMLRKIFPVRSCRSRLPGPEEGKSCLYYHIGHCLAPCLDEASSKKAYTNMVRQICVFLSGHSSALMADLGAKMREAAQDQRFEEAARLRDQLHYIERISMKQKVVSTDSIDRDVLAVAGDEEQACGVVLQVRDGKLIGREYYFLNGTQGKTDQEILTGFIEQHYLGATFVPEQLYLEEAIEDGENTTQWLRRRRGKRVTLVVPQRGEKAKLVRMAKQNAELLLAEAQVQREKERERAPHVIVELQRVLTLNRLPRRIEAFDISTLGGTDAVGSMVAFRDGRKQKGEYRRYKIKTVDGQDDYAMMKEVVGRRFRRLLDEGNILPDLILIDGGRGHLSSALERLKELGVTEVEAIGLAKRLDEVYLPHVPQPQNIPRSSSALRLLQRIRDEAHRFALEYHRTLRRRRTVRSELETIPGIGTKRRTALLQHFGSVKRLKEASREDIQRVKGVSEKIANDVYEYLHHLKKG